MINIDEYVIIGYSFVSRWLKQEKLYGIWTYYYYYKKDINYTIEKWYNRLNKNMFLFCSAKSDTEKRTAIKQFFYESIHSAPFRWTIDTCPDINNYSSWSNVLKKWEGYYLYNIDALISELSHKITAYEYRRKKENSIEIS